MTGAMLSKFPIRWMVRSDLAQVLAIERDSFPEFALTEDEFVHILANKSVIGMVVYPDENHSLDVIGYVVYELCRRYLNILNMAVLDWDRRNGVGRSIVQKLKAKLSPQRRNRLVAIVREKNLPAQLFFRACGLRASAIVGGAFDQSDEAGYLMEYFHSEPAEMFVPHDLSNRISAFYPTKEQPLGEA
jgi:ribosomal protein S18 acetylase RimI-like enzyme